MQCHGKFAAADTKGCCLQGDSLTCPVHGFELEHVPPPGRLDGLMCYSVSSPELITDATPMANITSMVYYERSGLSGVALAGIVVLVLMIVAALAGVPTESSSTSLLLKRCR